MKLTVKKEELEKTLAEIANVVKKKQSIAIIQMAKMDFIGPDKNIMTITGTDLETTMVSGIILDAVEEPKSLCFDVHTLLNLLKSLAEQPITITYITQMKIMTSSGVYDIETSDPVDFPLIPEVDDKRNILLENKYLERIVRSASGSATDELKPIMNGVYVCVKNKILSIVATDANIMMVSDYEYDSTSEIDVIIPASAISSIKSILGKYADVNFAVDEKIIQIKRGTSKLLIRRVQGTYVNYKAVIGKKEDAETTIKVDIADILKCMKRITMVSQKDIIKMSTQGMFIQLESFDNDRNISAKETIAAETKGEIEIGLSYNKFSQLSNIVNAGNVEIYMTTPLRAMMLYPEKDSNFLMLVMPVMIS